MEFHGNSSPMGGDGIEGMVEARRTREDKNDIKTQRNQLLHSSQCLAFKLAKRVPLGGLPRRKIVKKRLELPICLGPHGDDIGQENQILKREDEKPRQKDAADQRQQDTTRQAVK